MSNLKSFINKHMHQTVRDFRLPSGDRCPGNLLNMELP